MNDANERILERHDFLQHLGITIEDQSPSEVRLRLPHVDSLINPGSDAMQGGTVSTLIDHTGGAAVRTMLDDPLETPHATANLEVSYVRPAADDLIAIGEVVRVGGSLGVVSVEVTTRDDDGEAVVAVGTVSIHISRD